MKTLIVEVCAQKFVMAGYHACLADNHRVNNFGVTVEEAVAKLICKYAKKFGTTTSACEHVYKSNDSRLALICLIELITSVKVDIRFLPNVER